nr:profilin-2 [Ictidomys tridecemlineatus]
MPAQPPAPLIVCRFRRRLSIESGTGPRWSLCASSRCLARVAELLGNGWACYDSAVLGGDASPNLELSLLGGQPVEIDMIVGKDREGFFTNGLTLGAKKCSVIRDSLYVDGDCTMDIRTKSQGGEPTYNVAVGRAGRVLVFVMGKEGVHGGGLNKKAYSMAKYLRDSGF